MWEQMLIQHGAPTLAGLKAASLFTCPFESKAEAICAIRSLNRRLVPKGLRVLPLRYARKRALIYLYRPAALAGELRCQAAKELLAEAGYLQQTPQHCILELMRRLQMQEAFPHEIGLFLSYPPEDVRGFIEHKAGGYKCAGCWKVYGDVEKAQKTFACYRQCIHSYSQQWQQGISIERLTVAV